MYVSANLAGALPQGEANGLAAITRQLVETPDRIHVAIVLLDCSKITTKVDADDVVPTARIRRIEVISDPTDGHRMRTLLRREFERRTGKTVLPFALEEDLRAAFGEDPAAT
jgi:hypothetical protein